jgi:UDP-N-acetylmuramoylalanine--D-glutamate ligase
MAGGRSSIRRPPLPGGPYLVLGLARSGLAAASALRRVGETVLGADSGAPEGLDRLRAEGVEVHAQDDGLGLLTRVQAVIKSPGVPQDAPAIVGAHAQGLPVIGELELGWRLLANETIAVTGTNGKTTTVELIAYIHAQAGLPVAAAGNVGLALSSLAGRVDEAVTIVCETSSFQLEDTSAFAPEVAVLLNLSPDHLDRHAGFEEYVAAKLQVFSRQREQDTAVLPVDPDGVGRDTTGRPISAEQVRQRIARLGGRAQVVGLGGGQEAQMRLHEGALWWRGAQLLAVSEIRIAGEHNVRNAMAAAAVCLQRGVESEAVREGLRSFPGVKHRLEQVAAKHGISYVNDSKATNLASAIVALRALAGTGRRIHLIAGGQGKGQDFSLLREPVASSCAGVYLIGQDAGIIATALEGLDLPVAQCGELEAALDRASAAARQAIASARWVSAARRGPRAAGGSQGEEPEQVVLLAPGCASFDQFADFEARGDRFRELVAQI